jgi:hypothetical protein
MYILDETWRENITELKLKKAAMGRGDRSSSVIIARLQQGKQVAGRQVY